MARRKASEEVGNEGNSTRLVTTPGGVVSELPTGMTPEMAGGKFIDWSIPQADDNGIVPQFVNVTGKRALIKPPYNPNGKIKVLPWGILYGKQHRDVLATERPDRPAKFVERVRLKDGSYDPVNLLTEEQVVGLLKKWRGGQLLTDKEYTLKRIQGIQDNGLFDPEHPDEKGRVRRKRDTRPGVVNTVSMMKSYVEMRLQLQKLTSNVEMDQDQAEHLRAELKRMRQELFPDEDE